jgi:hypothetical protein
MLPANFVDTIQVLFKVNQLKEINQEAKNSSDKTTFKSRIKFIILILVVLIGIALFILFRKKKSC